MNLSKKLVLGALTTGILVSPLAGVQQNQASASEQPQTLKQDVTEEAEANGVQQDIDDDVGLIMEDIVMHLIASHSEQFNPNKIELTEDTTFEELGLKQETDRHDLYTEELSDLIGKNVDPEDVKGSILDFSKLLKEKYGFVVEL